jgi:hypothetical protein
MLLILDHGKISCFTSARVNFISLFNASGSFSGVAGGSRLSTGRGSAKDVIIVSLMHDLLLSQTMELTVEQSINVSEIIKQCDTSKTKSKEKRTHFVSIRSGCFLGLHQVVRVFQGIACLG